MGSPAAGPSGGGQQQSPTATGASVASLGFSAYSDVLKGQAVQASDEYRAATLENAAARTNVAAVQTGASASEQLSSHLGNIDAVRAAAHADPTSPTGASLRDWTETLGNTKKTIAVDQLMAQSQQEASDAAYLRSAGAQAKTLGYINAGTDVLAAVSKMGLPF
jgi:hypothetical protein